MKKYKFNRMDEFIRELPTQLEKGLELQIHNPKNYNDVKGIVLIGMGGSGIAGDILSRISSVPFSVVKDYRIGEEYIKDEYLYVFVSYSGNTEETLESFDNLDREKVFVITSDGKLLEKADKKEFPYVKLPSGYPPRCALGWIFSGIFGFVEKYLRFNKSDLINTVRFLEDKTTHYLSDEGEAFRIASKVYKRPVFLYTSDEYFPCILRWKTQINENSKAFCHIDKLPEMNHNEIVGLRHPEDFLEDGWLVFIKGPDMHPRNIIRVEETKSILENSFLGLSIVEPDGKSYLDRIFDLILLGDCISYYLARFYEEDAFEIKRIDLLKRRMSEK